MGQVQEARLARCTSWPTCYRSWHRRRDRGKNPPLIEDLLDCFVMAVLSPRMALLSAVMAVMAVIVGRGLDRALNCRHRSKLPTLVLCFIPLFCSLYCCSLLYTAAPL